jgi:hypothetical protein
MLLTLPSVTWGQPTAHPRLTQLEQGTNASPWHGVVSWSSSVASPSTDQAHQMVRTPTYLDDHSEFLAYGILEKQSATIFKLTSCYTNKKASASCMRVWSDSESLRTRTIQGLSRSFDWLSTLTTTHLWRGLFRHGQKTRN